MKRTFIRLCGTFAAVFMGVFSNNTANATATDGCPLSVVSRDATKGHYVKSQNCFTGFFEEVCTNGVGTGSAWEPSKSFLMYDGCWCKNVRWATGESGSSYIASGEMFCQFWGSSTTSSYISDACTNVSTSILARPSGYGGTCNNSSGKCYYRDSAACAKVYTTTADATSKLVDCCVKCPYDSSAVNLSVVTGSDGSVISMGGTGAALIYSGYNTNMSIGEAVGGGWLVTGNGGTGSTSGNCKYVASGGAVTDHLGTFTYGDGSSYYCLP